MKAILKSFASMFAIALLCGCVTVPVVQPVKKIEFPKYGFVIDEPSWNTLNCNERFMLSADESKAMKNEGKVRYDLGYGISCNASVTSESLGPDVRIGWRDTRFSSSEVLKTIIGEIAFRYLNNDKEPFTFLCTRVGEALNPLFVGRSQVCQVHIVERNLRYTVAIYNFATDAHPHTESWVMITDIFKKGYATEAWLKKVVETIRPLKK